jgi:hypothetical protein
MHQWSRISGGPHSVLVVVERQAKWKAIRLEMTLTDTLYRFRNSKVWRAGMILATYPNF